MRLLLSAVLLLATTAFGYGEDLTPIETALDRGDFTHASQSATDYIQQHPRSSAAHVLLARAEIGLNKPTEALRDLHAALRFDLNNLDALYYISKLTGVLSGQEFVDLQRIAPDSMRLHQVRAEVFTAKGENAAAEKEYLAALQKKPGASFLLNALADLKRHQEKYPEASKRYQEVLKTEPENFVALYGLGACFLLSHQPAPAIPLFRRALHIDGNSMAAAMALGEALLDTGHAGEAIALLEHAADADPDLRRVQFLLGKAYRSAGREKDAQVAFNRYREIVKQATEADRTRAETLP